MINSLYGSTVVADIYLNFAQIVVDTLPSGPPSIPQSSYVIPPLSILILALSVLNFATILIAAKMRWKAKISIVMIVSVLYGLFAYFVNLVKNVDIDDYYNSYYWDTGIKHSDWEFAVNISSIGVAALVVSMILLMVNTRKFNIFTRRYTVLLTISSILICTGVIVAALITLGVLKF